MSLDNVTLRAATRRPDRHRRHLQPAVVQHAAQPRRRRSCRFSARFSIVCGCGSPIALVARPGAALSPPAASASSRTASRAPTLREVLLQRDARPGSRNGKGCRRQKLEGSLFGDSREKATADLLPPQATSMPRASSAFDHHVPEWQGKGSSRALIGLARAELAKAGCTRFFLMSDCNSDWQF